MSTTVDIGERSRPHYALDHVLMAVRYTRTVTEPSPSDRDAAALRAFLADRDVACPGCGYNLRGLTTERCPECNQRLVIGVSLAEPKQRAFIAGAVGISLPLGFCVILLAWMVYMLVDQGRSSGSSFREIVPIVLGAVVGGALLGVWLMLRRALMKRPTLTRWTYAVAATLVAAAFPLWFMAIVR